MRLERFDDLVAHGHGWIEGRGRILRHKPYLRAADFLQIACSQAQQIAPHEAHCTAIEPARSEEHTSELQSRQYLVCRLLLEKKKKKKKHNYTLYNNKKQKRII